MKTKQRNRLVFLFLIDGDDFYYFVIEIWQFVGFVLQKAK